MEGAWLQLRKVHILQWTLLYEIISGLGKFQLAWETVEVDGNLYQCDNIDERSELAVRLYPR